MAKVQSYQAQRSITVQGSAARMSSGALTVGTAAAADFANTAVDVTSDALRRQKDADDNAWISRTTSLAAKDWAEQLNQSKQSAPEGADGFAGTVEKDFQAYRAKILKDAPSPEAAQLAGQRFDRLGVSLFSDALTFEAASKRTKRMTDFGQGLDALASAAFANPGQEVALLDQANGDLLAAEGTWMLPGDVSAQREKIPTTIAEAALRGRMAQDPHGVLKALEGDGDDSVNRLSPDRRTVLASAARAEITRREVAHNRVRKGLENRLKDLGGVIEAGFDPGDQMQALEGDIAKFGDGALSSKVLAMKATLDFQTEIRAWSPTALQNWVNKEHTRLNKGDVSGFEADRIDLAGKVLQSMRAAIKQDPLSWAAQAGVTEVQPVTYSGDGASQSMKARRDTALSLADYYGVEPRLLTDEEELQLKSKLEGASADEQVALAARLNEGFGPQAAGVFKRIAGDDPLFAHAGGLAALGAAQAGTARDVLFGRQVLKAGNKVLPPAVDMNDWTTEELGGALSETPATRGAVVEAAKAIYAATFMRRGGTADQKETYFTESDEDLWRESVQLATGGVRDARGEMRGGIGEWNGQSVLLPSGVRQVDLDRLLHAVEDADLVRLGDGVHGNGDPLAAKDLSEARLVDYGHGQYLVDMSGDGVEFVRGDGPNGYFVLDVSRLGQVMLARRKGVEVGAVEAQGGAN